MKTKQVTFKSFGVDLVGNLYLPEEFDENKKYKAILGASPFPQVKSRCSPLTVLKWLSEVLSF